MKNNFILGFALLLFSGCAGIKTVNPQEKNEGIFALDIKSGKLNLVNTYTCRLESNGKKFSAVAKTEESARKEVVSKCKDRTLISFCKPEKIKCIKNNNE